MAPTAKLLKGPPVWTRRRAYSFLSSLRYVRVCGGSALRSRFGAHSAVRFRFALEMTQALEMKSLEPERQTVASLSDRAASGNGPRIFSCRSDYGMKLKSSILARNCVREIAAEIVIVVAHKWTSVSHVKRDESSNENISRRSTVYKSGVASFAFCSWLCVRVRIVYIIERFIRIDQIEN